MLGYHQIIYLIHIFFVAPLFIYVGVMKDKTDKRLFDFLVVLGVVVLLHHAYRLYQTRHFTFNNH